MAIDLKELAELGALPDGVYLTPPQASVFLQLSQSRLAQLRCMGEGPVYLKRSNGIVRYRVGDLREWLAGRAA